MERIKSDTELPLPYGVAPVDSEIAMDPVALRYEFRVRLIELANAFDEHVDHRMGPDLGTELQEECNIVKDFVREELVHKRPLADNPPTSSS